MEGEGKGAGGGDFCPKCFGKSRGWVPERQEEERRTFLEGPFSCLFQRQKKDQRIRWIASSIVSVILLHIFMGKNHQYNVLATITTPYSSHGIKMWICENREQ